MQSLKSALLAFRSLHRDITVTQCMTLLAVAEHPGTIQAELQASLDLIPSNCTAVIDNLTERGWLCREPHATGLRKNCIKLTPEGLQVLDTVNRAMAPALEEHIRRFLELFQDYTEAMSAVGSSKWLQAPDALDKAIVWMNRLVLAQALPGKTEDQAAAATEETTSHA